MTDDFHLNAERDDAQRRENPEPDENGFPVPQTVLVIVTALVLWGAGYILLTQPNDAPGLGDRRTLAALGPKPATAGGVDGAAIYAARCAACHQGGGTGLPGVFPPLAGSEWVNGNATRLSKIVLHGVTGTLTVEGASYNGQMPSFKAQLDDMELAAVLTHVRSHFGNSAAPLDPGTVKQARAATAGRTDSWKGDDELKTLE